jgi:STE24 endopeptidase
MVVLVALTPAGGALAALVEAYGRGLPPAPHALLSTVLYALALVVLWQLAVVPARLYQARQIDPRYGARAPRLEQVVGAQAHAALLAFPAAAGAALVVPLSAAIAGGAWWALAAALLALALVAALHGAPRLVARLAGARPLAGTALADRLERLARQAGVPLAGIDEVSGDAGMTPALVTGAGRSRRVFLSSDLTRHWSDEEIAVVVAHELAHHAHHDLLRTLAADAVVLAAGLWSADRLLAGVGAALAWGGPSDLTALPGIALAAGAVWLAATPARHAYSRHQERRADVFALRLTGGADAFSAAIRRLGTRHLAEERPSAITRWLYHRHPPVAERLALAEQVRRGAI